MAITSAPVVITSATDILAITSAIQYLLMLQYVDITSATYTLAQHQAIIKILQQAITSALLLYVVIKSTTNTWQ